MARSTFVRQPLTRVASRYDRMARWYRFAEPRFCSRPDSVVRQSNDSRLKRGDTVLEIGCGTGRNLALLCDAVGADGEVIGVDASSGMLAQAQPVGSAPSLKNIRLIQKDAATLELDDQMDAVFFSLSYSVLPDRKPVLPNAWETCGPGSFGDHGRRTSRQPAGSAVGPIGETIATMFPGDPYSQPWEDLKASPKPWRRSGFSSTSTSSARSQAINIRILFMLRPRLLLRTNSCPASPRT